MTTGVPGRTDAHVRRVGLVLDQILSERDGRYSTDEVVIRFVEALAASAFDRIQFCSRVRRAAEDAPYMLDPSRFDILPLPWYGSVPELCLRSPVLLPRVRRIFEAAVPSWSLALAAGIHPLTPLALRAARRHGVPGVLWIRGDLFADIRHRLRGARRAAGLAVARLALRAIPAGTPVLTVGRDDYPFLARMGPAQIVYSSKFGEEDFVPLPRPPRPAGAPLRLLYVGRIAPEKGLDVLLEALRRVARSGAHGDPGRAAAAPRLTIVGWDYFGSSYGEDFRRHLSRGDDADLAERVSFAGHVPYGPRLFEIYDGHDALVLPSFTEGFPQVILEAMARGVPVVATRVGGVPRIVRHEENGLLVDAGDAAALAAAIARLSAEPAFAAALADAGQRSARPYTREVQADTALRFLDRCFPGKGFGPEIAHHAS